MPEGPLAGVRVLELTDELGSYCGKLLADLGADVVKVEPPGGERQRRTPPFAGGEPGPDAAIPFWAQNSSKRSLALDLEREPDRERARALALDADVIVEDRPPGTLARFGLGFDDLRGERPDLVYTSITGFGQSGPHAGFAHADIVGQAMAGVMTLAGMPEDPPNLIYGGQANVCASWGPMRSASEGSAITRARKRRFISATMAAYGSSRRSWAKPRSSIQSTSAGKSAPPGAEMKAMRWPAFVS